MFHKCFWTKFGFVCSLIKFGFIYSCEDNSSSLMLVNPISFICKWIKLGFIFEIYLDKNHYYCTADIHINPNPMRWCDFVKYNIVLWLWYKILCLEPVKYSFYSTWNYHFEFKWLLQIRKCRALTVSFTLSMYRYRITCYVCSYVETWLGPKSHTYESAMYDMRTNHVHLHSKFTLCFLVDMVCRYGYSSRLGYNIMYLNTVSVHKR